MRGLIPGLSAEVRLFFRVLLLGLAFTAFGYLLSLPGWDGSRHTVPFAGFALALVLGQGCLFPERQSGLREFFWVSIFFVLTTPLFQFAPLGLDHYNFHVLDAIRGTWIPCLMALLVNLVLASGAGVLFHLLHRWQYAGGETGGALRRALWVTLPPSVLVYGVAVVITNASVSIQLAFLVPVIATVFTALLVLRDPGVTFSERDRRILFPVVAATAMLCGTAGVGRDRGDIRVPGPAHGPSRPQPPGFLADRLRRVGDHPGTGPGPVERGLHVARHELVCLHGLRGGWEPDRGRLPDGRGWGP